MNGKELAGNVISVDFYERQATPYLNNTTDVIGNENLRALFIKSIDKNVSIRWKRDFIRLKALDQRMHIKSISFILKFTVN